MTSRGSVPVSNQSVTCGRTRSAVNARTVSRSSRSSSVSWSSMLSRSIFGADAGMAAYLGVDPTLVRLTFALLTVFGGLGVLLYLGAWVIIPDEVEGTSIAEGMANKRRS